MSEPVMIATVLFFLSVASAIVALYFAFKGSSWTFLFLLMFLILSIYASSIYPNQDVNFCELENEGIYDSTNYLKLCSVPDSTGDYVVYKLINIEGERKLARFSSSINKASSGGKDV